jgi:transposase
MTYPVYFRKKVLKIKAKEKLSYIAVAKRFMLSKTTVFDWCRKLEPQKNRDKKATKIDRDALQNDIEQYPDSYCYERAERLGASATGIRDAQYRLGVTYKKNQKTSQSQSRKKIYVLRGN